MFNAKRTLLFLMRTPLVPPPAGPPALELVPLKSSSLSRPRASSRAASSISIRGYADDRGKPYRNEMGSSGASTDDIAHTDAAFDPSKSGPQAAKAGVERETGKEFKTSAANEAASKPSGKQEDPDSDVPLNTSHTNAKH